jgi:hypothetical protein
VCKGGPRNGAIGYQTAAFLDELPAFDRLPPWSRRATAELGLADALNGNKADSVWLVKDLTELSKRRYLSPFDVAPIYSPDLLEK